jgi:hypothetical protein
VPIGPVQSLSVETGGTMRLSWGQTIAGGLTLAVVAGLLLLPNRLLRADQPVGLAIAAPQGIVSSVQAAPPRAIPRPHAPRPRIPAVSPAPRQAAYVPRAPAARPAVVPAVAVGRVTATQPLMTRPLVKPHRSAVISKLVPTAPLVRARVLAAVSVRPASLDTASSTAKTIAALAASLRKK